MQKPRPIRILSKFYDEKIDPAFDSVSNWSERLHEKVLGRVPQHVAIYGVALLIALCIPLTSHFLHWTFLRERAFIYLLIFYFDAVGVKNIFHTVDYAPGYKYEKALGGSAFLFLGLAIAANITTYTAAAQWSYALMALVVQITALEFILYRNKSRLRRLLKTRRGLVPMPPTLDECDHLADVVTALVRHDEVSPWVREALAYSLGYPSKQELREILQQDLENHKNRRELRERLIEAFGETSPEEEEAKRGGRK